MSLSEEIAKRQSFTARTGRPSFRIDVYVCVDVCARQMSEAFLLMLLYGAEFICFTLRGGRASTVPPNTAHKGFYVNGYNLAEDGCVWRTVQLSADKAMQLWLAVSFLSQIGLCGAL